MSMFSQSSIIGICGAGAMGAGIAQVAASAGHKVIVFDSFEGALGSGQKRILAGAAALLKRGKISEGEAQALSKRITWSDKLEALKPCDLIIEAVIESLDVKTELFQCLEAICSDHTYLATNTSSLSVSGLSATLKRPQNFLGLHFFNPAPVMKLVEVISGLRTNPEAVKACFSLMEDWGKQAVLAKDVPGFIVNRVARPFYSEGWQAYEEGVADYATLDHLFRSLGRFRMGPLELGDLIGHDINSKAARSVFESYFGRTRFRPSLLQHQMHESGLLGRKSGQGVYHYGVGAKNGSITFEKEAIAEHIVNGPDMDRYPQVNRNGEFTSSLPKGFWLVDGVHVGFSYGQSANALSNKLSDHVAVLDCPLDYFATECLAYSANTERSDRAARALITAFKKKAVRIADRPGALVFRTMLQLVNSASDAVRDQVGSGESIDKALKYGVNYPFGPLEWAREYGFKKVIIALENIAHETGDAQLYQPNQTLRAMAWRSS